MRLVTWNIRSLRDSRADVVAVLSEAGADVVCLQEAPRLVAPAWRARRLARDCGLLVASAGRPVAGVAVLVRPGVAVRATRRLPFPWTPRLHRRGVAQAVVDVDGRPLAVSSVHLGLDADERLRHADELLAVTAPLRLPAVIAGDLNDDAGGPVWRVLAGYQDAWVVAGSGDGLTFPADRPRRRIDGVLVDHRLVVTAARVVDDDAVRRASDHCPLVVDVGWPTDDA